MLLAALALTARASADDTAVASGPVNVKPVRPLGSVMITFPPNGTGRLVWFDTDQLGLELADGKQITLGWQGAPAAVADGIFRSALDSLDGRGWAVASVVLAKLDGGAALARAARDKAAALGYTPEMLLDEPPAPPAELLKPLPPTELSIVIDPPAPVTLRPTDVRKPLTGKVTGLTAAGVTVVDDAGTPTTMAWQSLAGPDAERLLNRHAAKDDARHALLAGMVLRDYPETWPAAMAALDRAVRLDGALKPIVAPLRRKDAGSVAGAWPVLSDTERSAAVNQLKVLAADAQRTLGLSLPLYETDLSLIYSDMNRADVEKWSRLLDKAYARLAERFDVPRGTNLWRGKLLVFALAKAEDFRRLDGQVFKAGNSTGVAGRCYQTWDGTVMIGLFSNAESIHTAGTVAHELTHGFAYRYRSRQLLANWVNEGLSEVTSDELTARPGSFATIRARARQRLGEPAFSWDKFFDADNIDFKDYPVAQTFSQFMVARDRRRYLSFINGMKDGMPWEQSLEANFGTTRQALIDEYFKWMDIRKRPTGAGNVAAPAVGSKGSGRGAKSRK